MTTMTAARAPGSSANDADNRRSTSITQFIFPKKNKTKRVFPALPQTSRERLDASLTESTIYAHTLNKSEIAVAEEKGKTVLYLAYGSNLCAETFRGIRGINPLSQMNVQVPKLRLTFDLPGVPYQEPCFGNSAMRDPEAAASRGNVTGSGYHKDRWHKDMVGCVYEVTPTDYSHIIATEGAGSSYEDILVDCYPLSATDVVPERATTKPFKAHTLFAPMIDRKVASAEEAHRIAHRDPSYAQPSARYLKLITDGAAELSMPTEYQDYLHDIRPYRVTTTRQKIGRALFVATWVPFIALIFGLGPKFNDENGRAPKWLSTLIANFFRFMWITYDVAYKRVFGDGERTIGDTAIASPKYEDVSEEEEEEDVMGSDNAGTIMAEEMIEETARLVGNQSEARTRKRGELV